MKPDTRPSHRLGLTEVWAIEGQFEWMDESAALELDDPAAESPPAREGVQSQGRFDLG